jgi:octaprenyl-diphosphate synthase
LAHADKSVKKELINIVKNHNEETKMVRKAVQLVVEAGGIEYAYTRMHALKDQALALLKDIPESEAKSALIGLVEYTIIREK